MTAAAMADGGASFRSQVPEGARHLALVVHRGEDARTVLGDAAIAGFRSRTLLRETKGE